MSEFVVRAAVEDEYEVVGSLRWQWEKENGKTLAVTHDEFIERFATWAREHRNSHHCVVAIRHGLMIGMAWLAIVRRVPTPLELDRVSGDVQSVYVSPAERGRGVGGALVRSLLDSARERGVRRVTVHSSTRAIPVYEREGFAFSPCLLQAERVAADN